VGKAERLTWHKAWTMVSTGFSISYTSSNGSRISFTTRITGKGQQWLMKRLLDAGVLVPVAATR
ncbi:hypothetical protein POX14_24895, partial [Escherichia coli]